MALELESLQQMGVTLRDHSSLGERWPSTDDEFADAVTTVSSYCLRLTRSHFISHCNSIADVSSSKAIIQKVPKLSYSSHFY